MYKKEYDNKDHLNVLLDMKESLKKQNELIDYLRDEQNHYDTCNKKIKFDNNNNTYISNQLNIQLQNNISVIKLIESEINDECNHEIEEDYIETGVESSMMKISYCKICKQNM